MLSDAVPLPAAPGAGSGAQPHAASRFRMWPQAPLALPELYADDPLRATADVGDENAQHVDALAKANSRRSDLPLRGNGRPLPARRPLSVLLCASKPFQTDREGDSEAAKSAALAAALAQRRAALRRALRTGRKGVAASAGEGTVGSAAGAGAVPVAGEPRPVRRRPVGIHLRLPSGWGEPGDGESSGESARAEAELSDPEQTGAGTRDATERTDQGGGGSVVVEADAAAVEAAATSAQSPTVAGSGDYAGIPVLTPAPLVVSPSIPGTRIAGIPEWPSAVRTRERRRRSAARTVASLSAGGSSPSPGSTPLEGVPERFSGMRRRRPARESTAAAAAARSNDEAAGGDDEPSRLDFGSEEAADGHAPEGAERPTLPRTFPADDAKRTPAPEGGRGDGSPTELSGSGDSGDGGGGWSDDGGEGGEAAADGEDEGWSARLAAVATGSPWASARPGLAGSPWAAAEAAIRSPAVPSPWGPAPARGGGARASRRSTRRRDELGRKSLGLASGVGRREVVPGVRRSQRVSEKPLRYWLNERVEYGRAHRTMPTVEAVVHVAPPTPWRTVADIYPGLARHRAEGIAARRRQSRELLRRKLDEAGAEWEMGVGGALSASLREDTAAPTTSDGASQPPPADPPTASGGSAGRSADGTPDPADDRSTSSGSRRGGRKAARLRDTAGTRARGAAVEGGGGRAPAAGRKGGARGGQRKRAKR